MRTVACPFEVSGSECVAESGAMGRPIRPDSRSATANEVFLSRSLMIFRSRQPIFGCDVSVRRQQATLAYLMFDEVRRVREISKGCSMGQFSFPVDSASSGRKERLRLKSVS